MDLRLHPRSVAPVHYPEKIGPHSPTRGGSSCNNAPTIHRELVLDAVLMAVRQRRPLSRRSINLGIIPFRG